MIKFKRHIKLAVNSIVRQQRCQIIFSKHKHTDLRRTNVSLTIDSEWRKWESEEVSSFSQDSFIITFPRSSSLPAGFPQNILLEQKFQRLRNV